MGREKKQFSCALITGASSGLGKALASFLSKKNIDLILTSRNSSPLSIDLAQEKEREVLFEEITDKKPDLIINNAAFGSYGNSLDLSIEEQLNMIDLNIKALVEISLHSARTLIEAGKTGTILNISSAGAFFPFPTFNTYCASKSFVNSFSLALDAELQSKGVRVLCACPGPINTNFRSRASKGYPQQKTSLAMPVEKAVHHLWRQIEKEQTLYVFDWKTKWMVQFGKWIPRSLLNRLLRNSIKDRYLLD